MQSVFVKGIVASLALVGMVAVAALPTRAETLGYSLINRFFDGDVATGVDAIMLQSFTQPGTLTSWSFFNNNPGLTLSVTPFLATRTGTDTYTIVAVGTTRVNAGTGIQSFAFDALAGAPAVNSSIYFGFHSGGATTGQQGVIELDTSAASTEQFALRLSSSSITAGTTGTFTPYGDRRVYSVQVATSAVVPEAGTYALLATGLLPLAGMVIRRRFV